MNNRRQQGRRFCREGRPHDYLYDPNYTICSSKDFYKDAAYGARAGAQIKLRPIFPSMFSELITDRRLEACLVMPRPNIMENFMPQHNIMGIPVNPMQEDCVYRREVEPTGADRARFISNYSPQNYQLARVQGTYSLEEELKKDARKKRPKGYFVNRGVQTDYREMETQTDPYSPPFTLPYPTAYPKVLALLKMTWGKGLPATLEDIVVIERALTRRMLEIGVHDVEDEGDFERRVKLMEELEAQQWADREKELNTILMLKMDLVQKSLSDLKTKIDNVHTMKMEKLYEDKRRETVYKLSQIKHSYLRGLRRAKARICGSKHAPFHRNIIDDYLHSDSPVYKPLARNGPNIDIMYKPPKYKFRDHLNIDDLNCLTSDPDFIRNELEFDPIKFTQRMKKTQPKSKNQKLELTLMSIYDAFKDETRRKANEDESAFMKQVITSTINRMTTPTVTGHEIAEEHKELCILNLQKVIRGRVIQTLMREELEENMASILQLKALHKADPYGLKTTYGQACTQANLQEDRELQQEKQNEVTEIMDQLEAETLTRMFDFLDKEMVRLLDERKIHALMILAERERRMKEATEAGRRQQEEEERRVHDEIFRQVVGIHQATVDMYLEDMYLETINRTADANAREYIQGLARTMNEAAYITAQADGDMEKEEMAADLVHCFMLPEMNRLYQRDRLDKLRSRYTLAAAEVSDSTFSAQGVIHETLDSIIPTIKEHMDRGEVALDATQIAVDNIIKGAVQTMMNQIYPKKGEYVESDNRGTNYESPDESQPIPPNTTVDDDDNETEEEAEEKDEDEEEAEEDEDVPEAGFEPISPKSDDHSLKPTLSKAQTEQTLKLLEEPFHINVQLLSDDERKEVLTEVEEILDSMPPSRVPVIPEFKTELGEKSLQVAFGVDVEETTASLYKNTTDTVIELFTEMHRQVEAALTDSEEEELDEESDVDSD